jgi:tetratricopeptide (TPR) repeat protein
LDPQIIAEPSVAEQSLAFWLPGPCEGRTQLWERISNVAQSEFTPDPGILAIGATMVPARQQFLGLVGRLMRLFHKGTAGQTWMLPSGAAVEQCGQRHSDLILVWTPTEDVCLDEAWIRKRWPRSKQSQRIGKNAFLVRGVTPPVPVVGAGSDQPSQCQHYWADELLEAARRTGESRRLAVALTDMGAVLLEEGDAASAMARLEEAVTLLRPLHDLPRLTDALDNLGLAAMQQGQAYRAQDLFNQAIQAARACGHRFGEKSVLQHLGQAYARLHNAPQAIALLEESLALAAQLRHQKHQAELHWQLAIQHAEQGEIERAATHAQSAVELFQQLNHPEAEWYASALRHFREGASTDDFLKNMGTVSAEAMQAFWGGTGARALRSAGALHAPSGSSSPSRSSVLQMALSATKAMAKFVGTGFKTVQPGMLQQRLRTCGACEHHTGLRCRLCGCFTAMKARLPHEVCPLGKWPI